MPSAKKNQTYKDECPKTLDDNAFYGFQLDEEQKAFRDAIWSEDKLVVMCNAKAGSGKTQIAVATSNLLYEYGRYDGIVCIMFPCEENKQGYLPGDITQKSEVYFEPIYQSIIKCKLEPYRVIMEGTMTANKYSDGYIKLLTSTYLRGTNFENKVIIIDEAQNGTVEELKKVLTRCCDSCKVIVIGHTGQIDIKDKNKSGFSKYIEHFRNKDWAQICTLSKNYRGIISQTADELTY